MASLPLSQTLRGCKKDETTSFNSNCFIADEPADTSRSTLCTTTKAYSSVGGLSEPSTLQILQTKKSSFQITRVVSKSDGDSVDDLDDVTNTEDASSDVHDISHATDIQPDHWSSAETVHSPCDFSPRSPRIAEQNCDSPHHTNDAQSRFRIVKVESRTPSRVRGRWMCMDFADPPLAVETSVSTDANIDVNTVARAPPIYFVDNPLSNQFTPAFFYSDGHPVLERTPLNSIADANIYDSVSVGATDNSELSNACLPQIASTTNVSALQPDLHPMSLSGLADVIGRPSDLSLLHNSSSAQLAAEGGAENVDSNAGTFAIDNKIEQAMDLVKSHLMFAVHEEVELLKEQIKELMVKNAQLEYENNLLRATASPETIAQLDAAARNAALPPTDPNTGFS